MGACECLCVCLCACLWLVCSLRKVECLAGGVGPKGGLGSAKGRDCRAPVDRASMAPGVFEHQSGTGQNGHSRFVAPTPEGDLESSGPRGSGHGRSRRSTPLGRRGPDQRNGSGAGPAQRTQPGLEWLGLGMRQDLRTPQPTPQAPRASTPTLPVSGVSWKPFGPPGLTRWFLVWCWQCSGGGPASAGWSPVAGLAAQVEHAPRREVRPVGPTCRAERKGGEAQGS